MSFLSSLGKVAGTMVGGTAGFLVGGPAGAAIGAGIGGLNDFNTYNQNKANKKAVQQANAYDMYTWDLANQYNDPKTQMERLKAAGLNPNLVYGSGNVTGNTTGVASSNGVASLSASGLEKTLPMAQGLANLRNTNIQNGLLTYQMGQTQAQTERIQAETQNLNNFLNGTGRSTYDPAIPKNIEGIGSSVGRVGTSLYNHLTRSSTKGDTNYFRKASEWFGDTAWKLKSYFGG